MSDERRGRVMEENRRFMRHPADIPIAFSMERDAGPAAPLREADTRDVGLGGLAFQSRTCPEKGQIVEIRIPTVKPAFRTTARVVWCRTLGERYEVGVAFLASSDAFRARMVEQVCQIERYRREVREKEGRALSGADAAKEWIGKYAAGFPGSA
jgi:hypothetical protein